MPFGFTYYPQISVLVFSLPVKNLEEMEKFNIVIVSAESAYIWRGEYRDVQVFIYITLKQLVFKI